MISLHAPNIEGFEPLSPCNDRQVTIRFTFFHTGKRNVQVCTEQSSLGWRGVHQALGGGACIKPWVEGRASSLGWRGVHQALGGGACIKPWVEGRASY